MNDPCEWCSECQPKVWSTCTKGCDELQVFMIWIEEEGGWNQ